MHLSREQLAAAMPGLARKPALLAEYHPLLVAAMEEAAINTPKRIAAFLAQLGHESLDFKFMAEIWGPTRAQRGYAKRKDLGNTDPVAVAAAASHGDTPGHFYMGHGPIQITGYYNHKLAGQDLGIDAINQPGLLAKPDNAFRGACWFWRTHDLNRFADKDQFETLTRRINGGVNGLDDRLERWAVAKRALAHTDDLDTAPSNQTPADGAVEEGVVTLAPSSDTTMVETAQTVVQTGPAPAGPVQTVVGGGPNDPAVASEGEPFWKRAMKLATGGGISIAAITGGIQAVTGLSPTAQVIVISAVIIGLILFGLIVLVYFAADRLLIKYSKSRADRINIR